MKQNHYIYSISLPLSRVKNGAPTSETIARILYRYIKAWKAEYYLWTYKINVHIIYGTWLTVVLSGPTHTISGLSSHLHQWITLQTQLCLYGRMPCTQAFLSNLFRAEQLTNFVQNSLLLSGGSSQSSFAKVSDFTVDTHHLDTNTHAESFSYWNKTVMHFKMISIKLWM